MSFPGKDDGYLLADAILTMLIISLAAAAVLASAALVARRAAASWDRAAATILERNADAEQRMGLHGAE
jgi:hypothetical protein